jgi:O-antigen/teichoic acid export membrane protein
MSAVLDKLLGEWRSIRSVARLRPFDGSTAEGRSAERYRRIVLSSISALGGRGVSVLASLITSPLLLAYLGKERFGLWSTITSLVAWATLLDFGIANGLVNCLASAHGREDRQDAAEVTATALTTLTTIALAALLVLWLSAPLIPWSALLAVRGVVDESTVRWSVVAALSMFLANLPLSIGAQIYAGYQRSYLSNLFTAIGSVAGLGAILRALPGKPGLPALVVVFGVGGLLGALLGMVWAFTKAMPWLRLRAGLLSRRALHAVMSRSLPIFLFQVGALLVNQTQAILLAHRCDLATVAEYAIAMRLFSMVLDLAIVITHPFVPSFREAVERGDHRWTESGFLRYVSVRLSIAGAGCLGMILFGNPLLRLWLRRDDIAFSPAVWISMTVLMIGALWVSAHSELLSILDWLWIQVVLVFLNGAVTMWLTWLLAPKLRVLGVVLASAAVTVLIFSWLLPLLSRAALARAGAPRPAGPVS